jgi:YlmC/YmxH family sporulation protein
MGERRRLFELGCKEVVCLSDGARLGFVRDAEIDLETGRVTALIIPGRLRWLGLLGREPPLVLPWESVGTMGDDILFVKTRPKS